MRSAPPLEILSLILIAAAGCGDDSMAVGVADAPTHPDSPQPSADAGPMLDAPPPTATVRPISLVTNSLVFDRTRGVIYASVPSRVGENGNSVASIDPETATVTDSLFVGSEPNVMALSDHDSFLYVGLDGSASVRRVDLAAHSASTKIVLGNNNEGPRLAGDIAVMPGTPHTIAVSRWNPSLDPASAFAGIVIFDDDVARPTEYLRPTSANRIVFADAMTLFGHDNLDSSYALLELRVDAQGPHWIRETDGALEGFNVDFVYDRGQFIGTSGQVVDAATFTAGRHFAAQGPVAIDPSGAVVTYLHEFPDSSLSLASFDRDSFDALGVVEVPPILSGEPMQPTGLRYAGFLEISATRFAFRSDTMVFILDLPAR